MGIIKICSVIIISAMMIMLLKEQKNSMHHLISATVIVLASILAVKNISPFLNISKQYGLVSSELIQILIKTVGISYITEFSSSVCKDIGESGLATGIELCGKAEILVISMPLFNQIMDICLNLINQ